jgi:hypothetical protein
MDERKEIELAKKIIKENNLPEKILREDLKKLIVKHGGFSVTSAENYIFVLEAFNLIKYELPFILFDKKFLEGAKK